MRLTSHAPRSGAGGRVHTSAASVAVLPQADELDVDIRDEDLRIDTYRYVPPHTALGLCVFRMREGRSRYCLYCLCSCLLLRALLGAC